MDYPLLIPNIAQKIEKTIKKLKILPQVWPAKFIEKTEGKKHRYSSVCLTPTGKKIIFYSRLHSSPYQKEKMLTEVKLAKVLIKKPLFDSFPSYYQAQIEKDFEWLTRQYFPSLPLEKKKDIEKLKKPLKKALILKLVKKVLKMNELPLVSFPFLRKFEIEKYAKLKDQGALLMRKKIISKKAFLGLRHLLRKGMKILEKENKYFCHGDFQIGNILIFNQHIKIIDLESAHVNNFAFDIAFLTTRLWQNPKVRRQIIESYFSLLPKEKKDLFYYLFPLDTFFIGYHSFCSRPREYTLKKLQERENFYKKLLTACVHGFSSLSNL